MLKDYGLDNNEDIINLGLATNKPMNNYKIIGWQGGIDSFTSFFGYLPHSKTLIIILSNNKDDANKLLGALAENFEENFFASEE
jgi:hypothetical protein